MPGTNRSPVKRSVQTASGRISYAEEGKGPVALFVHGVLLNSHLWRYQLGHLSDIRRCIAVDLPAHGDTEISAFRIFVTPAERLRRATDTLGESAYLSSSIAASSSAAPKPAPAVARAASPQGVA
jgi:pimeloyl-ACP methyl ester carboxylesterase